MDKHKNFATRLAELRKEQKISQYKLAEHVKCSRGQIGNYEQGTRQPDFETLTRIAEYFDVTTDYLLGRTDIKNNAVLEKYWDFIEPSIAALMADAIGVEYMPTDSAENGVSSLPFFDNAPLSDKYDLALSILKNIEEKDGTLHLTLGVNDNRGNNETKAHAKLDSDEITFIEKYKSLSKIERARLHGFLDALIFNND